jgi:hypothetical protein
MLCAESAVVREGLTRTVRPGRNYPDKPHSPRTIFKPTQSKSGRINALQRAMNSARSEEQNKYKNVAALLLWKQTGTGRWTFGVSGSVVAQGRNTEEEDAPVQSLFASGVKPSPWSRPAGPMHCTPICRYVHVPPPLVELFTYLPLQSPSLYPLPLVFMFHA